MSEVKLVADWLLFVFVDVWKHSNQSELSITSSESNPSKLGPFKSYSKTIIDSLKIQNSGIWIHKIRKNRILDREKCVLYKVEPERARRRLKAAFWRVKNKIVQP